MRDKKNNSVLMSIATYACARIVSLSKDQYYHHSEGLEAIAYLQNVFPNQVPN